MRALRIGFVIASSLWFGPLGAAAADLYTFITLAGWPGSSGSGDGTNYTARFYNPYGVAVDSAGNTYVADNVNCTIRSVKPVGTNWVVSTLAGLANSYAWADGTNSKARFNYPEGMALDRTGNLYVADSANHVIRKITPVGTNWVVSTLVGSNSISANTDGTNSSARFYAPYGVTVDQAGTLYVTDAAYNTIRKVTPVGTNWVVTTLAGSTSGQFGNADGTNRSAQFNTPAGLVVDSKTNLYVADSGNCVIRKVASVGTNWVVTTLAGSSATGGCGTADGTNSNARFSAPAGITMDSATNLYVADSGNCTIRKMVPAGTNWVVSTIGGLAGNPGIADGTNTIARFNSPYGLTVDSAGILYVADSVNNTVRLGVPSLTNAPTLRFTRSNNQLTLSWSLTANKFGLETRGTASPGTAWSPVTSGVAAVGTSFYWTTNMGLARRFYRLHKQ